MSISILSHNMAARRLLTCIIKVAIQDYQALVRAGIIKDGKQIASLSTKRQTKRGMKRWNVNGMTTDSEVVQLLHWWNEEEMEELAEMGDLRISTGDIRRGLEEVL